MAREAAEVRLFTVSILRERGLYVARLVQS